MASRCHRHELAEPVRQLCDEVERLRLMCLDYQQRLATLTQRDLEQLRDLSASDQA
jgi:hypothetical protein